MVDTRLFAHTNSSVAETLESEILVRTPMLGAFIVVMTIALLARAHSRPTDEPTIVRGVLPAAWGGTFRGKLEYFGEDGKLVTTSPLSVEIGPATDGGARPFKLTTDENAPPHEWDLVPVDGSPNKFLSDQKNGVLIDTWLVGGTLYSQYEIAGGHFDSRLTLQGDALVYEIVGFSTLSQRSTQLTSVTPPLRSFPLLNVQRAVLKRS